MSTDLSLRQPIITERLELVLLPGAWLRACSNDDPRPDLGFTDPHKFLSGASGVVNLRIKQVMRNPTVEPWLLRAMVLRDRRIAVGYINFHAPPDDRGMVEIGYNVVPAYRRKRYATEAAEAMWGWAAQHGARVLRAAIAPGNVASRAMVQRAGFVEVGQQVDDIDGLELIFEKPLLG